MKSNDSPEFEAKNFIAHLTHRPGVYRMLNAKGQVLYIGKAGDLKKRVSSYFYRTHANTKTSSMMKLVKGIEVTVTNSESEALILEYNLIKQYK
ncbi:GIY-YIG nuclease family protein, partial [Woeseiaceae bacterium]|nr:GIY-YIG nuclease family protein [Woeseiaceae bacterium]